jgi:hypothetical protein
MHKEPSDYVVTISYDGSAHMRGLTGISSIIQVGNQSQHVLTHMVMQEPATCNMTVADHP